jgi:serine/threonine-protein kinase
LVNAVSIGPGAILGGKYRLEDSIGRGGMGEVFEATTLSSGVRVAIKVVNRTFLDGMLVERLRREAEAARRVQSEFVPELYEVETTADGELFLVMERLHGQTLAARLRQRGGLLSWDEVAPMGEDMLRGLFDAHAAGVVHRDLKPGNIFIESLEGGGERTRILDFGVCKLDVHDGESLTTTGEAVGTIAYMAPEQIRGASRVDERADLYSFAMVVFEALCGRLAYDANGSIALIAMKLEKEARRVGQLARVPIPAGLDELLGRCLSRRPAERPASAAELLQLWRALGPATEAPRPQSAATLMSEPPTETGVTAAPSRSTTVQARRGARISLMVGAGALVASCVVLGVALAGREHRPVAAVSGAVAAAAPLPIPTAAPAPSAAPAPTQAPLLQIPPVVLSATAFPPPVAATEVDAGAAAHAGARSRPGRHTWIPAVSGHHQATEPQIVTEPRY